MLHYLKLMLQLLMSPLRGWEDVAECADTSRRTLLYGLLPLAGFAAISCFLGAFYQIHPTFAALLRDAVIEFIKYVVAYFVGVAVLSNILPRLTVSGKVNRERVELMCAYGVGIMSLIGLLSNLFPMEIVLFQFLPIYVVIVLCLGRKFVDVAEQNMLLFAGVSVLGLIVPVYLIERLLAFAV